ncbi:hypothetical protein GGP50_002650 [Salinibacter ruber]|uniref:O-antigen ligase family protein n=1 Tax=Salinibacter ruber TaxID=146919 RepID=UPI002167CB23|nr:hypothetical protein [Salinibacter ruber]MCS4194424.1 hypothetical protein [Salinibacter ruber]
MTAYRKAKVRRKEAQSIPPWLYLLGLYALLVVVQGALRKWVFPELSTPLYAAKDAVLLGALGHFLLRNDFRLPVPIRKTALPLLWGGLTYIVCLQAFNINVPSILVGILGIRSYLLYTVLLVLMPRAMSYVKRPSRLMTFVGLGVVAPVLVVGVYQFLMPTAHWINQYAATEAHVSRLGKEGVRISGTFSYIQGMSSFLTFSLGFSVGVLVAGIQWGKRWYQVLGGGLTVLSLAVAPMNGARSLIFGFFLSVPFVLYAAFRRSRTTSLFTGLALLVLVGGYIGTQVQWATEGWTAFQGRIENVSDQESRIEFLILDPIRKLPVGGILGYGAGSTHQAARVISTRGQISIPGVSYEPEPGRVILELGILGALLLFGLRLWMLWMAWKGMMNVRNALEAVICITAFVMAFQFLYIGKIVFDHVGGSLYWLSMGTALWVWGKQNLRSNSRRSLRPSADSLA